MASVTSGGGDEGGDVSYESSVSVNSDSEGDGVKRGDCGGTGLTELAAGWGGLTSLVCRGLPRILYLIVSILS